MASEHDDKLSRDVNWILREIANNDRRYEERFRAQEHALKIAREQSMSRAVGYILAAVSLASSVMSVIELLIRTR